MYPAETKRCGTPFDGKSRNLSRDRTGSVCLATVTWLRWECVAPLHARPWLRPVGVAAAAADEAASRTEDLERRQRRQRWEGKEGAATLRDIN